MKRVLIIINPCAGKKKANKYLTDIINIFTANGFICTVLTTTKRGDGTEYVNMYAKDYDMIVAIGGDGTFNEVASGIIESGLRTPVGYIPAGSTNDFAQSLGLSESVIKAAKDIALGEPIPIDVGRFNDRGFTYVACFGAFSKASYDTPQNVKNAIGHLAYILSGISSISTIRPEHVKITVVKTDGEKKVYEDDFLFGAITNATSFGGVLKYNQDMVDMGDGVFELLLVRMPHDPLEVSEIIHCATNQTFNESSMFIFVEGKEFVIEADSQTDWSLDGEFQSGENSIVVKNCYHAVRLMMKKH